jgi:hypothetical protein
MLHQAKENKPPIVSKVHVVNASIANKQGVPMVTIPMEIMGNLLRVNLE